MTKGRLLQMHNVGIVVESLDAAISFFTELGLKLEGRATVEGEWAGRVTGLGAQCVEIPAPRFLRQIIALLPSEIRIFVRKYVNHENEAYALYRCQNSEANQTRG